MKIIDLLNKIANGEEVPKKIKYEKHIYEYAEGTYDWSYYIENNGTIKFLLTDVFNSDDNILDILNGTVEILEEEKKIPEKINKSYDIRILDLDKPHTTKDYDMEQLIEMVQDIYGKQCEIIDYLKIKGDE